MVDHLPECTAESGVCSCGADSTPRKRGRPRKVVVKRSLEPLPEMPADILDAEARYDPRGPF